MPKIVLVRGHDLISWGVQVATWSHWNHAAFELDDGRHLSAMQNGVCIYEPNPGDIIERFTVVSEEYGDHVIRNAITHATSQLGKPYDYAACLGIALHRDWQSHDHWFCSELVAWSMKQAGCNLLRYDKLDRITPGQLGMSPLLVSVNK